MLHVFKIFLHVFLSIMFWCNWNIFLKAVVSSRRLPNLLVSYFLRCNLNISTNNFVRFGYYFWNCALKVSLIDFVKLYLLRKLVFCHSFGKIAGKFATLQVIIAMMFIYSVIVDIFKSWIFIFLPSVYFNFFNFASDIKGNDGWFMILNCHSFFIYPSIYQSHRFYEILNYCSRLYLKYGKTEK